jgi:hypothetical protein
MTSWYLDALDLGEETLWENEHDDGQATVNEYHQPTLAGYVATHIERRHAGQTFRLDIGFETGYPTLGLLKQVKALRDQGAAHTLTLPSGATRTVRFVSIAATPVFGKAVDEADDASYEIILELITV